MEKMRVAVLIAARNRKEKTLSCLRNCGAQVDFLRAEGKYSFEIYLTDDGSTDGTPEAVAAEFPEVHIIRGDGTLYWNRGMRAAWTEAAKGGFDFYIWLNDDTVLERGAFAVMLENSAFLGHNSILVGTAVDGNGAYSYGGRTLSGRIVPPDPDIPIVCDIFNGNFVLVPKAVYEVVGMMDPIYCHSFGDYDYGVRAAKAGIASLVAPGILGKCDRNPGPPKWRDASLSLKERVRALRDPKGRPFREQFVYDTRSANFFTAVGHYVSIFFKVLFPAKKKVSACRAGETVRKTNVDAIKRVDDGSAAKI